MIRLFDKFDILLVEGLKTLPLPRISVFRDKLDESYFPYMDAVATDESIDFNNYSLSENVDILDLNDPEDVISWILKNAKEV